jgi:GT2 family glycosyltransferase
MHNQKGIKIMNPKVIVLILSYNGKHLLDDSVSSYLANDYDKFEIVIIDNGSTDNTKEYVEKKWTNVKIIRIEENRGYSGGFNFGLEYAFNKQNADYVLITNNDVKADRLLVRELVKVATSEEKVGFVTGKVYYYDNPTIFQTVGKYEHPIWWNGGDIGYGEKDNGQYDQRKELQFSDDVFTLVSKDLYSKIGGYDTTFFLQCEEYDWQARAKKFGYKIYFSPNAKLWHKESMTIGKRSAMKEFYNSRNSLLVILKNREAAFFKVFFWNFLTYKVLYKSFKVLLKFEIKKSVYIWFGFFSGILWGIKNRKFLLKHFY